LGLASLESRAGKAVLKISLSSIIHSAFSDVDPFLVPAVNAVVMGSLMRHRIETCEMPELVTSQPRLPNDRS
jgi:hypothetical protein